MGSIQFSSFSEFLQMGQYAFHVWMVYGLFAIFIFANLFLPLRQRKAFIKRQHSLVLRDKTIADNRRRSSNSNSSAKGGVNHETS